ncbi:nucleoside 2-deoxyribosyltransferase domain-containing protein [uncultured Methanomethylovorans sp.]|uniref:nucleoside 2-deoxyribosyltransferase n=1 Tax=uncultured Methanomethylovorans sp. TaxID=183759 RepID=UPI002AA77468|nr:nucleoside 2-deoxyribosyltransferase domain-containing protein [uncultured Methanomethylovorans sp.]
MINKKNIYLAGPLFSHAERDFNVYLRDKLVENGFSVFLPQEDGNDDIETRLEVRQKNIFEMDVKAIDNCEIVVAVLDGGSDVDSGTAWEIGYAYAKEKKILGIRTDFRTFGPEGNVNLMIEVSLDALEKDVKGLISSLKRYA